MIKITIDIEGMACGMCESHVNDAIAKAFDVKSVTSSHKKKQTEIISKTSIDEDKLRNTIEATGYKVLAIKCESYKKNMLSFFRK